MKKRGAAADIILVVQKRLLHRLADIGESGKMHDGDRLIAV